MNTTTRVRTSLASAAAAAMLLAGTMSGADRTIDIRVTPEVRLQQKTPATSAAVAQWSARANAARTTPAPQGEIVAVHYPTVVLGTTNYLQPAQQQQIIAVGSDGYYSDGGLHGDALPMFWGGGSDGALFGINGVNGVNGVNGAFSAATIRGIAEPAVFSGRVSSPFVGVAGPGFGFGVAGPSALPGRAGLRAKVGTIGTNQTVVMVGDRNGTTVGGVMTGATEVGGTGGNLVIGPSGTVGNAGNIVVGVGGAAVSGGRR